VVENRPTAGGMIAAAAVSSTAPDGYTMFVLSSAVTIAQSLLKTMPFDPRTAFAPVSTAAYFDLLILTKGDGPLRSIEDVDDIQAGTKAALKAPSPKMARK